MSKKLLVSLAGLTLSVANLALPVAAQQDIPITKSSEATTIARVQTGVNLNVNLDVLGIANEIKSSINSSRDRAGFVKNLMNTTFYAAGQKYNVMVFNLSVEHQDRFRNVKFYGSAVYDGVTFGIWVFEDGEFTNKGDGGWINWAFRGWFDRNGGHVKFRKP